MIYTKTYIDGYFNALEKQFDSLLLIFKNLSFKNNDHVIFDIDEVCLCNLMYHGIDIPTFNTEIYNYNNGIIPAINECKKLFNFIHDNNIQYSFITGRRDRIRQVTIDNLKLEGFSNYKYLFTCPDDYVGDIQLYKENCRTEIINKGYNIVCSIGDQLSDIYGTNTGLPILIFNPFYVTK